MRPSFALWEDVEERRGRGKGVAVRVEAARFAAQGEGVRRRESPPSGPFAPK